MAQKTTNRRKPLTAQRRTNRKSATPKRGGIRRALLRAILFPFRVLWAFIWRIGLIVGLIEGVAVIYVMSTLPPALDLVDGRAKGSVTLTDVHDQVYAWRGDQFGGIVQASTVSPFLRNAVVATEDKRFDWHIGIDPRGIASAIKINLREGRGPLSGNGGSTITQQTAKLLCLGVPYDEAVWKTEAEYERDCRRTTIWRKIKEATYALAMEAKYTKDEILTIYLNRAFLGAGARGFEAASQRYFGISATQVDMAEAAMLAGLLKAPSRYAPTNNLARAQGRATVVIGLMEDQGYISPGQAEYARAKPAELSQAAAAKAGGYFADWVMASGPEYFTRNTTEDVVIRTTLDPKIQQAAEQAVAHIFGTKVRASSRAEAAVVVLSADGAVRAMVGGRDTKVAGAFNRATQARRQTGSTFKPFVYATALELGYSPYDSVDDSPVTYRIPGSGKWSPTNYTRKYKGTVSFTTALAESLNVPAVKVSEAVGRDFVRKVAQDFGIISDLAEGPALALGASESTLLEMTGAYAGILNGGSSVTPYGLQELRLQGEPEPLVQHTTGIGERVIDQKSAEDLVFMMYQVIENGTGRRAKIPGIEAAGKTGTTQAARDAWFIGFTNDYVVGVWMGNDDNTPLNQVTGSGLPSDIWRETVVRIYGDTRPGPLPMTRRTTRDPVAAPSQPTTPVQPVQNSDPILDALVSILTGGN